MEIAVPWAAFPVLCYTAAQMPTSDAGITTHATNTYLPLPKAERDGIGLCLSGGGYRAALFHLGALRRLNELGILTKLKTISSVSGGSIISAHIATRLSWPLTGTVPDWESRVAAPLRGLTSTNIRTPAFLASLLPWTTGGEALAKQFEKHLTTLKLDNLPDAPRFIFCATDLAFGVNWVFQKTLIGDYEAGHEPAPDLPLALAVAASSCFPPVFKPLRMNLDPAKLIGGKVPHGPERDKCVRGLTLSDGGVYDNLGLEPIWKDHAVVLSSDGGALFGIGSDTGLIWELKRYIAIPENQALAVRKRWLMASFIGGIMEGTYWGIGGATSSYDIGGGYSKELASEVIAGIRTDLDSFSDAEAAVLEDHGYLLADAAVKRHVPTLLPAAVPPLAVPHPGWMDEGRVRAALKHSGHRSLFGRSQQALAMDVQARRNI
jgi:NTE family protein